MRTRCCRRPASPVPQLASLLRRLQRKAAEVPGLLDEIVKALDAALISLDAAQAARRGGAARPPSSTRSELESAEERLFALRAAARKYAVPVDDLPQLRDTMRCRSRRSRRRRGAARTRSSSRRPRQREVYDAAAAALSASAHRRRPALLERAVMAELPALKLERAEFIVEHDQRCRSSRAETASTTVEFWVRTNPGTRPGPLMKVASGGELSRFLLALKVALADRGSAPTLVFDEIDTGVGGAVADAIGQRLARLAERVQVLSVTHAPQVAARARTPFPDLQDPAAPTRVADRRRRDGPAARQEEIARMLAGATITDEARAAAERLLSENTGIGILSWLLSALAIAMRPCRRRTRDPRMRRRTSPTAVDPTDRSRSRGRARPAGRRDRRSMTRAIRRGRADDLGCGI